MNSTICYPSAAPGSKPWPNGVAIVFLAVAISACSVQLNPDAHTSAPSSSAVSDAAAGPSADDLFDSYLDSDRAMQAAWQEQRRTADVLDELAYRTARDQEIRKLIFDLLETPGAGPDQAQLTWVRLIRRMHSLDRDNANWLKRQLEVRIWFTISEYGAEADNNAFLIVQHATHDPDFMRDVHARFEQLYPQGEIAPDNYALLTDRLAVMEGLPQPFGSQFECREGVQSLQTPLADPEPVVDERRAEVGLPTMAQYRALLPDCATLPG